MPRYHISGTLRRELTFRIDDYITADTDEEALDTLCETLDESEAVESEDNVFDVTVEEVADEPEDRKLRRMGAPSLFDTLERSS